MSIFEIPNHPLALGWDEWATWEAEAKRRYPVRWFLSKTLPRLWFRTWDACVADPWYWLKCALWYRYNMVRIKSLPPTWCDRDEVLLHAAFQVFQDFVDREKPWQFDSDDLIAKAYGDCEPELRLRLKRAYEMRELYGWWQVRKCCTERPNHEADNEMLRRLVAIRRELWT